MKDSRVLILTPFRNEAHSFPLYLKALCNLDYPKKLIDVFWLENDSSDKTLQMLKKAQHEISFNSVTLESIKILGSVEKGKSGEYYKDIPYSKKRHMPWLVIWNDFFLPLVRKSKADYVLCWWADAVPPLNVITEYLKVFKLKKNAGWVGGSMYRRHPLQNRIASPRPRSRAIFNSKEVVAVSFTGHIWMNPRAALAKTRLQLHEKDIHYSIVEDLKTQGLKVYYQPSVCLKHVSTDGKIYVH